MSSVDTQGHTGYCLEAHDLAASKLVANREKDRIFVTTLLLEKLIDSSALIGRVAALPVDTERIASIPRWVTVTASEA